MSGYRVKAVVLAYDRPLWRVLVCTGANAAVAPPLSGRRPTLPPLGVAASPLGISAENAGPDLPSIVVEPGSNVSATLARHLRSLLGTRVLPTELCRSGWYAHDPSPVDRNDSHSVGVFDLILPEVIDGLDPSLTWLDLRETHNWPFPPDSARFLRDAYATAPPADQEDPIVTSADDRHVPSMLTLLRATRERTDGAAPGTWHDALARMQESHIGSGGDFLVATLGKHVIATAGLEPVTRTCVKLSWVMVHHRWRQRGLGGHLVDMAEQRAWELGFQTIALDGSHTSGPTQRLFESRGYTRGSESVSHPPQGFAATKRLSPQSSPMKVWVGRSDVH